MSLNEIDIQCNIVKNDKKRKTESVVEEKKKKIKHLGMVKTKEETTEIVQEIEVVKKDKKKKKKDAKVPDNGQKINIDTTEIIEAKSKVTKKMHELPTVTIAVPGSILDNAQSPEFRTYLAGQIARAACIYKIDEVCLLHFLNILYIIYI